MRKLIFFVIIKILAHNLSRGEVLTMSPSLSCPGKTNLCLSLDQLATHAHLFDSNTTLIFLSGIHTLSTELSFFNTSNISRSRMLVLILLVHTTLVLVDLN